MSSDDFPEGGAVHIWFHGTNEKAAHAILETGFRAGTYFAKNLADAIGYGGRFVFEVAIQFRADYSDLPWQVTTAEPIPPGRIVRLTKFTEEIMHDDPQLRKKVFERAMAVRRCKR